MALTSDRHVRSPSYGKLRQRSSLADEPAEAAIPVVLVAASANDSTATSTIEDLEGRHHCT
jgi:hypothetical protein